MRPFARLFNFLMLLLIAVAMAGCANRSKAEDYARAYLAEAYPNDPVVMARCESRDSDDNGRVRCNVRAEGHETEHIECPSGWLWQPMKTQCVGIKRN